MPDELVHRVLEFLRRRRLLVAGDRVGVAVSGGADSVALLRLLLELRSELGIALSVVHLNHRLRGAAAEEDAAFVAALAAQYGLPLRAQDADARAHAETRGISLEAAGRELRYAFFAQLLADAQVTRVATGHTADDQAETVLLRLLRGAGTRGLAGIHVARKAGVATGGAEAPPSRKQVVRPLLSTRRAEVEQYLRAIGQEWREDASNQDRSFLRNRVRHELVPQLEQDFNPAIVRVLAETAEIARAEEDFWGEHLQRLLEKSEGLPLAMLLAQPVAVQRRLVRGLGDASGLGLDFQHIEAVLEFARKNARFCDPAGAVRGSAGELATLAHGWRAVLVEGGLRLEPPGSAPAAAAYEHELRVPGEAEVPQLLCRFRAIVLEGEGARSGYNREQLLDARRLGGQLKVRNWRPGDRFWPAHTKAPRKVKELLQQRHVPRRERALWPVVESAGQIVWMRGFAVAADCRAPEAGAAVAIDELPLEDGQACPSDGAGVARGHR